MRNLATVLFSNTYASAIWTGSVGSSYKSKLKKLLSLQNKVVKLIGGGLFRDKATPFNSQLGILKLTDLFKLEVGKFVHAHFKNKLPLSLSDYFILTSECHKKILDLHSVEETVCIYLATPVIGCKNVLGFKE